MYVKITNGTVDTYPYNVGQLRRDNPNTSFPKQISPVMLESHGIFEVKVEERPFIDDRTQSAEREESPMLVNGKWAVDWIVADRDSTEVDAWDANVSISVRGTRDELLTETDWTQVNDSPVDSSAWATYRQSLRDVTDQTGFPNDIIWPTKP